MLTPLSSSSFSLSELPIALLFLLFLFSLTVVSSQTVFFIFLFLSCLFLLVEVGYFFLLYLCFLSFFLLTWYIFFPFLSLSVPILSCFPVEADCLLSFSFFIFFLGVLFHAEVECRLFSFLITMFLSRPFYLLK